MDKHILLLEDDLVDVMTIKRAVSQLKIKNELHVAGNGEEGLVHLEKSKELPGLIILDINMPKMNGLEFLEELKKKDDWKTIPVVILTTSEEHQDRIKGFNLGVSGYMVKPVDYDQFKDMVKTIKDYWDLSQLPY